MGAPLLFLHLLDALGQIHIRVCEPTRDMGRKNDSDGLVGLEMDVRVVVRRDGGFRDPVDERHSPLEALEGEGLREGGTLAAPARARGE